LTRGDGKARKECIMDLNSVSKEYGTAYWNAYFGTPDSFHGIYHLTRRKELWPHAFVLMNPHLPPLLKGFVANDYCFQRYLDAINRSQHLFPAPPLFQFECSSSSGTEFRVRASWRRQCS
jgi:hypothetical protein